MADMPRDHALAAHEGSVSQRLIAGAVAGLVGGVLFGLMMGMMGMLPMVASLAGSNSGAVGFIVHRVISAIIDLPREVVERLAKTTTMFTCPRGRTIYRAGEVNEALFLLKKGRVQIVRESADGKRLVSASLGPETFFGEMALIGQRFPRDSTAEAVEDALVCVLSQGDLERLILEHPKVGLRFLEQLSARLLDTEAIVEEFAFKSISARLAGLLGRLAAETADGSIHASHQELADMVATYRETVTLTLNDFRARGLVELGRRNVRLLDPGGLEALAEA